MKHMTIVAGARPNFMKIAPIIHTIKANDHFEYRLVHTGQHYDKVMSDTFFDQLDIPKPDTNLGVGSGTHAEQTAAIMTGFEKELLAHPTDLVLVVGDVNSTMATAIVAKKLHIKVAHVEGGIRSGDQKMPEEINRMVTDSISDYFFTTTESAGRQLQREGHAPEKIIFVGNTMIDTLLRLRPRFQAPEVWDLEGLQKKKYFMMTLHRPSNVDQLETLDQILKAIAEGAGDLEVVFPVHPRTKKQMDRLSDIPSCFRTIAPLGYLEFNYLVEHARGVITDSGGITEEATVMNVPCMTLRPNTERPETIEMGTNELVGSDPGKISDAVSRMTAGNWKSGQIPPLWDGKAAERIVEYLYRHL